MLIPYKTAVREETGFFTDLPGSRRRIYHLHVRKAGGTSLNFAFFRLSGAGAREINRDLAASDYRLERNGMRIVGWSRERIEAGDYDYAFSHLSLHEIVLPVETYTVTILRDPAKRVLSHYKMLLDMRDNSTDHPAFKEEGHLIENGFAGFLKSIPRRDLLRQISMFSAEYDVDEAFANITRVSRVMLLETFSRDLALLEKDIGMKLPYVHERKAKVAFTPTDREREMLREVLAPEYTLLERVKAWRADGAEVG